MLSILIPTYNTKIDILVDDLYNQCVNINIDFEILCFDDGSSIDIKENNRKLTMYKNVIYRELANNLGRAKIRNHLVKFSKYEKLLFLDADSGIIKDDFILTYIKQLDENVIYGGRLYQDYPPENINKILHWKYGKEKESLNAQTRKIKPYLNFLSNNFLIDKKVFEKVRFDNSHSGYGYEDTLFAMELKKRKIKIKHIDNPTLHLGLEDASIFLSKTENALKNLVDLNINNRILDTRLLKAYNNLNKLRLAGLLSKMILIFNKPILKNLYSSSPQMLLLQSYKLAKFIEYVNQNKEK